MPPKLNAPEDGLERNRYLLLAIIGGLGKDTGMKKPPDPHHRHQFPAGLISYAVWLYLVFSLSLRDVELILA
jgi:hypothetical protein